MTNLFEIWDSVLDKHPNQLGVFMHLTHSYNVSNTHSSPKNGVTNFCSKNNLPKGYPGFFGRIWIFTYNKLDRYKRMPPWGHDVYHRSGIHTGSGGSGIYGFSEINNTIISDLKEKYNFCINTKYSEIYKTTRYKQHCPYGFEVKIFLDDFPELFAEERRQLERKLLMIKLKHKTTKNAHNKYHFGYIKASLLQKLDIDTDQDYRYSSVTYHESKW